MLRIGLSFSLIVAVACFGINKKLFARTNSLFTTKSNVESSKSGIGWDSHKASEKIPDVLVKSIEGNESMRRKFEMLCRTAQVRFVM